MSDNQRPAGGYALLVHLSWGNGQVAAYTTWSDPIVLATDQSVAYLPTPIMEVDAAKQTGLVKDEPWSLTIRQTLSPLNYLSRPSEHTIVTVRISELDPLAAIQAPVVMWQGPIVDVTWNLKDKPGCCRATIGGIRGAVQYPLGVESKTACARVFGDKWCGVNLNLASQPAAIASVTGKLLSVPGLTIPPGRPAGYWRNGRVLVDGLSVPIVDGTGGIGGLLRLGQFPPPEWAGVTGIFYPGCDKSFGGTCGCTGWSNTVRFFGVGSVKPAGSPVLTPR